MAKTIRVKIGTHRKPGSNVCPNCHETFPAHKNNTKHYEQLTSREQEGSIRASTWNLKRDLHRDEAEFERRFRWIVKTLAQ